MVDHLEELDLLIEVLQVSLEVLIGRMGLEPLQGINRVVVLLDELDLTKGAASDLLPDSVVLHVAL